MRRWLRPDLQLLLQQLLGCPLLRGSPTLRRIDAERLGALGSCTAWQRDPAWRMLRLWSLALMRRLGSGCGSPALDGRVVLHLEVPQVRGHNACAAAAAACRPLLWGGQAWDPLPHHDSRVCSGGIARAPIAVVHWHAAGGATMPCAVRQRVGGDSAERHNQPVSGTGEQSSSPGDTEAI